MVTIFQQKVYNLLKQIPKGKVTTYKILAEKLNIKGYQAIGTARKNNPFFPNIPCHRVVCSDGSL
ncbi:MAG: MGMT family protein [Candidatus Woesearchaeota archaeon]